MSQPDRPVDRLDSAIIAVSDLASAVHAYTTIFGWPPSVRGRYPERGLEMARFGFWNGAVELVAPIQADTQAETQADTQADVGAETLRAHLAAEGPGPWGVVLGTGSVAAAGAALTAQGLPAPAIDTQVAIDSQGQASKAQVLTLDARTTRGLSLQLVERAGAPSMAAGAPSMAAGAPSLAAGAPSMAAAAATPPPEARHLSAIDHLVVRTADPDASVALYAGALGIRLALDRKLAGTRMLFFRTGGVTLEVVEGASEADVLYGVAYRTVDIDGCQRRLAEAGFEVDAVRAGNKPGTRVFSVRAGTCGVPTLILHDPSRPAFGPTGSAPAKLSG